MHFCRPQILKRSTEPEDTWILDIVASRAKILKNMHTKTRYNIRLAEKKGVTVRVSNRKTREGDLKILYRLAKETAERNRIKVYDFDYYKKFVAFFSDQSKNVELKFYIAEHKGKPLSAIIILYFGDTANYMHGASASEGREMMANYTAQWRAIQDAKDAGKKLYDFWGVNEKKSSWSGITRFKKGFGGYKLETYGSWDYVLNHKWYETLKALRIIKRLIRK